MFFQNRLRNVMHLTAKELAEMIYDALCDFFTPDCTSQHAFERRRALPLQPAWNDQVEVAQIRRDVVRETVRRYPAAQMDSNCCEFFNAVGFAAAGILYPDSGHACAPSGGQAEIGCRANERLFQLTHVPADVTPNRR